VLSFVEFLAILAKGLKSLNLLSVPQKHKSGFCDFLIECQAGAKRGNSDLRNDELSLVTVFYVINKILYRNIS